MSDTILEKKIRFLVAVHGTWYIAYSLSLPFLIFFTWGKFYAFGLSLLLLYTWFAFGGCPLFIWENGYRKQMIPPSDYPGTFLSHYLSKLSEYKVTPRTARIINVSFLILMLLLSGGAIIFSLYRA